MRGVVSAVDVRCCEEGTYYKQTEVHGDVAIDSRSKQHCSTRSPLSSTPAH